MGGRGEDERAFSRLDPTARSEQILAAATELFRSLPYPDVSLDAVAQRAGVTRGLVHHYFGAKRDLYLAVVESLVQVPVDARLVPGGADGPLDEVLARCVDGWMALAESAGGLWSGGAGAGGLADADVDAVLSRARDDLVERMVAELPFSADLDRDLLRAALRAYAALARVATQEWLGNGTLSRDQTAALLRSALVGLARDWVRAMGAASSPTTTTSSAGTFNAARGAGRGRARR